MKTTTVLSVSAVILILTTTVCFAYNSATLDNKACQELDAFVAKLDSIPDYTIQLNGHTDFIGDEAYNQKLSEKRALAVKQYLISKQVDSSRITVSFYGETQPAVPNDSETNFALNRRVELTVTVPEPVIAAEPIVAKEPVTKIKPTEEKDVATVSVAKKTVKKNKVRRRLVWTGWKHGFHWNTSGR